MFTVRANSNRLSLLYLAAAIGGASVAYADTAAVLQPLVRDDTFAVAFVRPAAVVAAGENRAALRGVAELVAEGSEAAEWQDGTGSIQRLHELGIERLYAIVGLGDVHRGGGPVVVATVAPGRDMRAIESALLTAAGGIEAAFPRSLQPGEFEVRRHPLGALLIGSRASLDRAFKAVPVERDDILASLTAWDAGNADLGIVFAPGPDFRRVVRELWPQLPPPLEKFRGELADRWLSLTLEAKTQAGLSADLVLHAADVESAQLFSDLLQALPAASEQFAETAPKAQKLKHVLETIVAIAAPRVDGSRVVMSLPGDVAQQGKLRELLAEASDAALESGRRQQRMQQFKQMALAIHTFADARKHLPPPSLRNEQGQPLLSWRVAILPYLEESKLFQQFRLDEPWDSPHNLALAKQMPDVYADPSQPRLAKEGKTTYLAPVGPGTVFDTDTGIAFRDISDGTSKTILLVEVAPENAVVWTKPEDWEVDMDNPLRGLSGGNRDNFVAAYCDAHARAIPLDTKPEILRAFLTRAGKEVVDWP
jgi:hypothetical protein